MHTNDGSRQARAGGGSIGTGGRRVRRLGLGVALLIAVATTACATSDGRSTQRAAQTDAASTKSTATANRRPILDDPVSGSPSTTAPEPAPTPTPTPAAPIPAAPKHAPEGATLPFVANPSPDLSSTVVGVPEPTSVVKEAHAGFDRYRFSFVNENADGHSPLGSARPGWDVRYVGPKDVVEDGSGAPVAREGAAALRISFTGAPMGDEDCGEQVVLPDGFAFGGDYEGHVTWFLGLDGQRPFRAFFTGTRTVNIDVVNPAGRA
jgi:hypothetical protein